jgi:predicted O-methyltransferase YrrM
MYQNILKFLKDVPGWLTTHEGQFLTKAVKSLGRNEGAVVEIGSYCGKSTIWIALSGENVYAVDPHKGDISGGKTLPTLGTFLQNVSDAGVRNRVHTIIKTSKEAAKTWKAKIKFLFIDGLHDYSHAAEDYSLWSPFITTGGIVAMHDAFCGWQGAGSVALRKIVKNPEFTEIGVTGSIIWGKKGKATVRKKIQKLRFRIVIELCQVIYNSDRVPQSFKFIIIHKFLRIFLINRFSSFGTPTRKNSAWQ